MPLRRPIGAVSLCCFLLAVGPGCGAGAEVGPAGARTVSAAVTRKDSRFFSPRSVWNRAVPAQAPLDPRSFELVSHFAAEVAEERRRGEGPSINTSRWSVPLYRVPADQPRVRVRLRSRPERLPVPALRRAWGSVPLPRFPRPARGRDRPLVVWQPSSDSLWEFWGMRRALHGGWKAAWGGAIRRVTRSSGVYGPRAWPGADSSWGASASALSIVGGLITFEDLERGRIDHALAMSIPRVRAGEYSLPARRTDGTSTDPLSLPEGAHLRLDPALDLASLGLPRPTLMLAEAAQKYGIVLRDRAGIVVFYGQDPVPTGEDPYNGPGGYYEGLTAGEIMARFPWDRLQLLRMDLRCECG
jgi:hypothetical protein